MNVFEILIIHEEDKKDTPPCDCKCYRCRRPEIAGVTVIGSIDLSFTFLHVHDANCIMNAANKSKPNWQRISICSMIF